MALAALAREYARAPASDGEKERVPRPACPRRPPAEERERHEIHAPERGVRRHVRDPEEASRTRRSDSGTPIVER